MSVYIPRDYRLFPHKCTISCDFIASPLGRAPLGYTCDFFCTMVQISFITYPSKINGGLHKITHNATIRRRHLQSWPMPLIGSAPLSHVHFLPGNSLDWLKMSTDWLRFFSLNQHLFPSWYTKRRSFIEAEQPTIMSPPHMASGECIMFWAPYRA